MGFKLPNFLQPSHETTQTVKAGGRAVFNRNAQNEANAQNRQVFKIAGIVSAVLGLGLLAVGIATANPVMIGGGILFLATVYDHNKMSDNVVTGAANGKALISDQKTDEWNDNDMRAATKGTLFAGPMYKAGAAVVNETSKLFSE